MTGDETRLGQKTFQPATAHSQLHTYLMKTPRQFSCKCWKAILHFPILRTNFVKFSQLH